MNLLGLVVASVAFFCVGGAMVLYELSRIKAGRPILKGSPAVDFYYVAYLAMFCLGITTGLKAIIG